MADKVGRCRLKIILKSKAVSQVELSEKTGITVQMLSNYATNRKVMSLLRARQIARALHVPIEDLYTWDDKKGGKE